MDWLTNFFMNSAGGLTGLPPGDAGLLPPPPGDEVFNSLSSPDGLPKSPAAGFAAPGGPPAVPGLVPSPATPPYNPISTSPLTSTPTPSIGSVLAPTMNPTIPEGEVPMPTPRPQVPQASPTALAHAAPQALSQGLSGLASTLRGVQAPHSDVVKPSTPHGPPIQHIQSGSISQLLAQLYPGLVNRVPLASQTLGQAVGTGRY